MKQSKPKPVFSKTAPLQPAVSSIATSAGSSNNAAANAPAPQRSTLADWAPTEEDEYLYSGVERRQRGGRRRKKKRGDDGTMAETDWDDLYDPARPTNVEEYLRSDERIREVREWKAVLYAHRRQRRGSYDSYGRSDDEEEEEDRRGMGIGSTSLSALFEVRLGATMRTNRNGCADQFAPPDSYSFAPPPISPPREVDDATGDDAYARRLAMSGGVPPAPGSPGPQPPPPPPEEDQPPPPQAPGTGPTISRAPVRYDPPPEQANGEEMDIDVDDEGEDYSYMPPPLGGGESKAETADPNAPRSRLPGQSKFAERLMSKYGWTKGSGLGADESGITSALRVHVEKRRKRPDAEGGGWAEPGGRGKIIGGKRKHGSGEASDEGFGPMSQVIVLRGMLRRHGRPTS